MAVAILDFPVGSLAQPRPRAEHALQWLFRRLAYAEPSAPAHARLVDALSADAAVLFGMPAGNRKALHLGALLHDIGKLAVPHAILGKPGALTASEWRVMREHPAAGVRLLAGIVDDDAALAVVHCHHERWDGGGYPRRLAGDEIPLGARIVAVADAFHAMIETRPYRAAVTRRAAIAELRANAGGQFDPACVDAVCAAIGSAG
jgi:HD-GYP domain-containing protein (c-di-GMP phosphodiesterase class II)